MAPRRASSSEAEKIRVVPTNPDPIASLALWSTMVTFGGQRYEIPALDAATWLQILLAENLELEEIFPGLAGPSARAEVNNALLSGLASEKELVETIQQVIEAVSGRRWWITLRLCRTVRSFWERAGGEMARRGITPQQMPLGLWLDAAYATCFKLIADTDPKKLTEFTQALVMPPPEEGNKINEQANSQAFLAAMRQAGGM